MLTFASLLAVALCSIELASSSCLHNTHLHPREMEGETLKLPNFNYGATKGPVIWHALAAENAQCASGLNQSPINIDSTVITTTGVGAVNMSIPAGRKLTFENLGTNVEVLVEGMTMLAGQQYNLKQFHFHTPSEHKINSEYFPIEVHMVHQAQGLSALM